MGHTDQYSMGRLDRGHRKYAEGVRRAGGRGVLPFQPTQLQHRLLDGLDLSIRRMSDTPRIGMSILTDIWMFVNSPDYSSPSSGVHEGAGGRRSRPR